ncbi:MAG TPA: hypothetical protein VK731_11225 [Candidatus Cybelea sp.]|jgi:rhodanese-related sulfurtransferase|nr:hypothetical protein [Candidatus Cybelea sp.]
MARPSGRCRDRPPQAVNTTASSSSNFTLICIRCKSGVHSLRALQFLREQGFKYLKSVNVGVSAWSDEIDHNVPKN